jgi:hypothetical protein
MCGGGGCAPSRKLSNSTETEKLPHDQASQRTALRANPRQPSLRHFWWRSTNSRGCENGAGAVHQSEPSSRPYTPKLVGVRGFLLAGRGHRPLRPHASGMGYSEHFVCSAWLAPAGSRGRDQRQPFANWPSGTIQMFAMATSEAEQRFKEIKEAHAILSNRDARARYDASLAQGRLLMRDPPTSIVGRVRLFCRASRPWSMMASSHHHLSPK